MFSWKIKSTPITGSRPRSTTSPPAESPCSTSQEDSSRLTLPSVRLPISPSQNSKQKPFSNYSIRQILLAIIAKIDSWREMSPGVVSFSALDCSESQETQSGQKCSPLLSGTRAVLPISSYTYYPSPTQGTKLKRVMATFLFAPLLIGLLSLLPTQNKP